MRIWQGIVVGWRRIVVSILASCNMEVEGLNDGDVLVIGP